MPRRAKTDRGGDDDKATPPDDKRDLVITPAGPIPKENVHPVGPNEIVRRNADGTYTIVLISKSLRRTAEGAAATTSAGDNSQNMPPAKRGS